MGMLLAFAPFIAYAVLQRTLGALPALAIAALISLALAARDAFTPGRHVKTLEIGSVVLFGGLALFTWLTKADWPILQVRLWVDAGLMLLVILTLVIRKPFTLAYAREQVPQEHWDSPQFLHVNDVITAGWAVAFAVLVLADLLMLYVPDVPLWIGVAVTLAALAGAIQFTKWYPDRVRGRAANPL